MGSFFFDMDFKSSWPPPTRPPANTPKSQKLKDSLPRLEHPFLAAARLGKYHDLRRYVQNHRDENFQEIRDGKTGYSALHFAAERDHFECVFIFYRSTFL